VTGLRWALGFLTILPVRPKGELEPGQLGRAAIWYPAVGLALGLCLWAAHGLLGIVVPAALTAGLTLALWVGLTGGLHLDGVADCGDGLLASATPARRLEILSDVHVGAFGVASLILVLLVKTLAIGSLAASTGLLLAPTIARWTVLLLARAKPARDGGLGGRLHAEVGWPSLLWGLPLLAACAWLGWQGVVALVLGLSTTWLLGRLAMARLGGQTGDVLGASIELVEVAVLVGFSLRWGG
jgi:adenosylcobinamide-GDP ribazoletransferase